MFTSQIDPAVLAAPSVHFGAVEAMDEMMEGVARRTTTVKLLALAALFRTHCAAAGFDPTTAFEECLEAAERSGITNHNN